MSATLWSETAVKSHDRPILGEERTADVCVVGAGVSGVAASFFLSDAGLSVVLLEAGRIGSGAVGKSSGYANAGLWVPPSDIIKAIGKRHGERLIEVLGNAPRKVFELVNRLGLDCDAENRGTLQCAPDDAGFADLTERFASWTGDTGDLKLADARETTRLTGTNIYKGALVDYRAGIVQPLSYVRSLAQAAEKMGATIFEQSTAKRFERVGNRWRISTESGSVTAKWLLVTTEAHIIGEHFGLSREYVPMPFFNMATRKLKPEEVAIVMPAGQPIVDLRKVVSSYRFDAHNRLVVGSIGEVANLDGAINKHWVRRKIGQLFPNLRNIVIEYAWTGLIGVTDNHMPTIHSIGIDAYALGGYNGRGIAAGTVFAEAISQFLLGTIHQDDLPVPVTQPKPTNMAALRGKGLRAGAAAFHMVDARRR